MTTKTTREFIAPNYMKEFQCIGSACDDTCCAGWKVIVDKDTYKKYRNTNHPELKSLLKENVKRNRSAATDVSYAKIKMDSSGACTLLYDDHLCRIQKELGPDFLSNTCAVYPRNLNMVDNVVEKSATLSCPEAARLTLFNKNGIEFYQDTEPANTKGFVKKNTMTKKQQDLFWELRIFIINTLQNRSISIEERLIILGMFLRKYNTSSNENENLQLLISEFNRDMENLAFSEPINQLPKNIPFKVSMCKSLLKYRTSLQVTSNRYLECLDETIKGLGLDVDIGEERIILNYTQAYENSYKSFIQQHEYILENYLVNYVFTNLFPFDKKTVTDSFTMLVLNISMIKLHLIGMAKYHNGLTIDLVIKLFQSYSKTIDHNSTYLYNVEKLLQDSGYNTLAHMVVLVKD
ncbi:flagellin lysine-N-methylase [Sporosarcina sp. SAFN-015]|uniref:flagellin lysine-N-methylase n=1 Tax=Sporosarcina sp. SAFN-015 TaxID=3387274 RepID=UPI003F8142AC